MERFFSTKEVAERLGVDYYQVENHLRTRPHLKPGHKFSGKWMWTEDAIAQLRASMESAGVIESLVS